MAEIFSMGDQQTRPLYGESPDSMESTLMRTLLGDKPRQQGLVPYQGVHRTHDHVNQLQVGNSLGHHVLGEMLGAKVSLAILLPPQQVDPSVSFFEWTIERFRPGIAGITPEEAPMAELTYATEPRYRKLQRRGVAIRMTGNVMHTFEGMARLRSQTLKLAATMLQTIEQLTIRELVTAHDGPMFRRKMTLDKYGERDLADRLHYDASRFSAWNRQPDVEAATDMSEVGKLLSGFTLGPYAVLFPAGRQAVLGGQVLDTRRNLTIKTMNSQKQIMQFESPPSFMRMANGSLAFPVPDYGYGTDSARSQPLLRATMISEYILMTGLPTGDLTWRTGSQIPGGGFSTGQRDVLPYDTDQDAYDRVSFKAAFEATMFVPENSNGGFDIVAGYIGKDSPLNAADFEMPRRRAPSRVYWEGGARPVTVFGQFDRAIVPRHVHRQVGNTIAAAVHAAEGPDVGAAIASGIQFLRTLAAASMNVAFVNTLFAGPNSIFARVSVQGYASQAPDLANLYGYTDSTRVFSQNPDGSPSLDGQGLAAFAAAINASGTPPFLCCLGGLTLLSRLADSANTQGRALELGKRAKDLLEVAGRIYAVLSDKFPTEGFNQRGPVATNPVYRPMNHLAADGFATFFASVFLNSQHLPLIVVASNNEDEDEGGIGSPVVTPFVWTPNLSQGNMSPNLNVTLTQGTSTDPLTPNGDQGGVFIGRAPAVRTKSHLKTPWMAQHVPVAEARAHQSLRRGRRGGVGGRIDHQAEFDADQGEDSDMDLYGITPAFTQQQRTQTTQAIGARPIPGFPMSSDIRRLNLDRANPMTTENAKRAWDDADAIDDPLVRVCTMVYLTAPCDLMEDYRNMMRSDILVPFDILLTRPTVELDMYSVIVMKPGIDTGFQGFADTLLDFGKDVDHQTRKITFTMRHATVLVNPDHVAILPSRMARRYIAGGGVRLYTNPDQMGLHSTERPDFIAVIVPMGHKLNRVEPIGGIDVEGLYGPAGGLRYPDAQVYEDIWSLSAQAAQTREYGHRYFESSVVIPDYTWEGEYLNWNRTLRHPAKGHRRGGSHPRCRDVWDGNEPIFPEPPNIDVA